MPQVYDSAGTTRFEFTFCDVNRMEWRVKFAQGLISISSHEGTQINVKFPEEDHWTYKGNFVSEMEDDTMYMRFMGAQIKNNNFALMINLHENEDKNHRLKSESIRQ